MAPDTSTRRVYSAEQLQRLRSTASQPALNLKEAIEERDGDDAELVKGTRLSHAQTPIPTRKSLSQHPQETKRSGGAANFPPVSFILTSTSRCLDCVAHCIRDEPRKRVTCLRGPPCVG